MSIALVQQKFNFKNYSTSHPVVLDATPAAGSTLVLLAEVAGTTISGVSGGGVTWTKQVSSNVNGDVEIWAGANASGAGGTATVTVTLLASDAASLNLSEWSGMPAALTAGGTAAANNGRSLSADTATITPTAGHEVLLVAAANSLTGLTTPGTPANSFIELNTDGGDNSHAFAYRILASASGSTYSTSWVTDASYRFWDTAIAGLDGSGGGSPTPTSTAHAYVFGQAVRRAATY